MKEVQCVDAAGAQCGEGLLWDEGAQKLWWVDIAGETLHSYSPLDQRSNKIPLPYLVSALALDRQGEMLCATIKGMGRLQPDSGDITLFHDPESNVAGNRLNDMTVAPDGALWVGSMSEGAKNASGALYRYAFNGVRKEQQNTTISNGLAFSPDGTTLYFIDSVPGVLHRRRGGEWDVLCRFDDRLGKPDGLTVDRAGTLWIAICNQGRVIAMTPEGKEAGEIRLPCETVTNCTFGGADLKTLFITTATFTMSDAEKAANPVAGGLFACPMAVAGLPPYRANRLVVDRTAISQ